MWPGPYGEWGSRKYLLASLDQSLSRMGLEYVDIFYSHRFDPETPLEETMDALAATISQGKALYVGISSYSAEKTREAEAILRELGVRLSFTSRPTRSSTAGSRPSFWTRSATSASAASASRRSPRACSLIATSPESPRGRARAGPARCRRTSSARRRWPRYAP